MAGPVLRTDIVDVYVYRRRDSASGAEFLQMRRSEEPMAGSWQPVMGHVRQGETAVNAALRELAEETGYRQGHGLLGFWQLESLNSYFLAGEDCVMLSPGFAAEVEPGMEPTPDPAHDAARWVRRDQVDRCFLWPGQRLAIEQVVRDILAADSPVRSVLRIPLPVAPPRA